MAMDLKALIDKAITGLKEKGITLEKFQEDPVKILEGILGVDLPNDKLDALIDGIKLKLGADKAADALKGLGGLFGKKK